MNIFELIKMADYELEIWTIIWIKAVIYLTGSFFLPTSLPCRVLQQKSVCLLFDSVLQQKSLCLFDSVLQQGTGVCFTVANRCIFVCACMQLLRFIVGIKS